MLIIQQSQGLYATNIGVNISNLSVLCLHVGIKFMTLGLHTNYNAYIILHHNQDTLMKSQCSNYYSRSLVEAILDLESCMSCHVISMRTYIRAKLQ